MGRSDDSFIGQLMVVYSELQPHGIEGRYFGTTTELGAKMWIIRLDNGEDFLIGAMDIFDVLIRYEVSKPLLRNIN